MAEPGDVRRGASAWFADLAWLPDPAGGRVAHRVVIETAEDRITAVGEDRPPPPGATRLPGLVLPGLANAHSHAFHRALRGRVETCGGSFWTWRDRMYALADRLDPDHYRDLACATYCEMALAGVTTVGEFHYLHHAPSGRPYAEANVMQAALAEAAADAGVRVTLLDTCYLRGGFDQPLQGVQRRFADGDVQRWAERASSRRPDGHVALGAAIHSVRAVDPTAMEVVRDWAADRGAPLHVHVSEQPAENAACLVATGRTPAGLLAERGVLGARTTAVHATHLTDDDIRLLGSSRSAACLCPTTERALGDGVGPAAALHAAGSPLCVGSDSHAMVDLFEEARAVELNQRLASGERGRHRPEQLLHAATRAGMLALGWDGGELARGRLCDLVAVDLASPRLAGFRRQDGPAFVVFAATAADVTHVVVGGRLVVEDRRHRLVEDVRGELHRAIGRAVGA
ncbi:MAG TPA: formimidoylglutamate deiminase [Nitriliruptorales bacterium]|nr:formimidoylglutamate deiminase [Nitriliruptorales bacterium]